MEERTVIMNTDNLLIEFKEWEEGNLPLNAQVIEILELNSEQLTIYLEGFILGNPFVNIEYSIEQTIPAFERYEQSNQLKELQRERQSLDTYLFEQILLYRHTEIRDAMVKLVDYIDERGYIPYTVAELAGLIEMDPIVTLDGLTLIQQLQPAGIGAYDHQECLMLQTEQDQFAPPHAYTILKNYYEQMIDENYQEIADDSGISLEEIENAVGYYQLLRSHPATLFDSEARVNLIPDLTVEPAGDDWSIRYNYQYYPELTFDEDYYQDMDAQDDPEIAAYIPPHKESFEDVSRNLRIREMLILKVMRSIFELQADFFTEQGDIQPLSLKEIAEDIGVSEQVIARIVSNKNVESNHIVYGMVDFINVSQSKTREGFSANYIKGYIQEIISNAEEELTDEMIVEQLQDKKILVSEKIVNRYRKNINPK